MTRFEDEVGIQLACCGEPMRLAGNLSLRGPAPRTTLGYECQKCFRRVAVTDEWPPLTPDVQAEIDVTE